VLYVSIESLRALSGAHEARHSTTGIVLAAVSLTIMPVLSRAQRSTGRQLGSASVVADSKQTLLCTYLSAILLVGLGANALFGWWWAGPAAALVIPSWRSRKAARPGEATPAVRRSHTSTRMTSRAPAPAATTARLVRSRKAIA
jgi:hypothetical protein